MGEGQAARSPAAAEANPIPEGLTTAEARRRAAAFGPNALADEESPPWRRWLTKLWSPIPWLLEAAILAQLALGANAEAAVTGGLLLLNTTLGWIQERRAAAALAVLASRLAPTALVRRDGQWSRRPAAELVPGDVVRVPLGAVVPADARIVSGSVLVDQSMLTGESVPVEAQAGSPLYASTLVRRGQAVAEVTATGARTHFGRAAELVRVARVASTEQRTIVQVARNLAILNSTVAAGLVAYAAAQAWPVADLARLALTALLASVPVALPATFTLSAALGAQRLARRGVLLVRLSAAHEAAAMDVLCADKTGTLTRSTLAVDEVVAMPGWDRERVVALAGLASSEADQDPIDAAVRLAATAVPPGAVTARRVQFTPFDPETRMSEAVVVDQHGTALRVVKGALRAIATIAEMPPAASSLAAAMADRGHRVLAVAAGPPAGLRLAGLVGLSDPPREDAPALVATLRAMGVGTVMVTGDSPVTAGVIARQVGIAGPVCPVERLADPPRVDAFGVFARVLPEEKHRLVQAFQRQGHVVGMCGDGANDAPALRQAQLGIAVASATDVAKAAAGMVLTEPGLAGVVDAVREGREGYQRLLTYVLNMLVKKMEIVLLLALGLLLTGHPVMTPVLVVLMMLTNDVLSMSLTTDRARAAALPSVWHMRSITVTAGGLAACKLAFSASILALGALGLRLEPAAVQTLVFVTLVFGNQAVLYALREQRHLWHSMPGRWVLAASAADLAIASALAVTGTLMVALPGRLILVLLAAAAGLALVLDHVKLAIMARPGRD